MKPNDDIWTPAREALAEAALVWLEAMKQAFQHYDRRITGMLLFFDPTDSLFEWVGVRMGDCWQESWEADSATFESIHAILDDFTPPFEAWRALQEALENDSDPSGFFVSEVADDELSNYAK